MSSVRDQAKAERERAVQALLAETGVQARTLNRAKQIDAACKLIESRGDAFTTSEVARVLAEIFQKDAPAESTIRNNTRSGETYRAIIDAWRVSQLSGRAKRPKTPANPDGDLSDSHLQQIQPEAIRMSVLVMRTELRNMRNRYCMLQSLMHERVIRPGGLPKEAVGGVCHLSRQETDVLLAFLNPSECGARGLTWAENGQLTTEAGLALSRPGLRDVLVRLTSKEKATG